MTPNDMAIKRSILLSAIGGFSPEIQPIKETAIDKIYDEDLDLRRIIRIELNRYAVDS